jgi:NAD(P)-dependent dehydrogenase (short-subunit alcohol dehydrogenase family)
MNTNITKKLAGTVALLTGGSRGVGAVIAKRLAPDGADVASVFLTNGGYNGVQQVLRLSTSLSPKPHQIKLRRTPESER